MNIKFTAMTHKLALPWTIKDYNFEFLRENRSLYKKAARKVGKEFQIKNHICRLVEFYRTLKNY